MSTVYYIYIATVVFILSRVHNLKNVTKVEHEIGILYLILTPVVVNGISYIAKKIPHYENIKCQMSIAILLSAREWDTFLVNFQN